MDPYEGISNFERYKAKASWDRIRNEMYEKEFGIKYFIHNFTRKIMTVVCQCRENGQNKDIVKGIKI